MQPAPSVVILNGGAVEPDASMRDLVSTADLVLAADGGLAWVAALGRPADVVVGDLDSATPDEIAYATDRGAQLRTHPADKDATDFELAMRLAVARGAERVTVLGVLGDRIDHVLATLSVACSPAFAGVAVRAVTPRHIIAVVRDEVHLEGAAGDLLSLLPVGGAALGVRTTGLRYVLSGQDLDPFASLGVSNVLTGSAVTVRVEGGVLLAVLERRG